MSSAKPWVIYVRVSTEEQATEGVSLAAQREVCASLLKAGGHVAVEVIEDAGYSAKNLKRPGAQRLLQLIDSGSIAGVCIYRLDRLTRSLRDLLDLVDRFERAGAAMKSVSEMLDTASPMGRFIVSLLGAMAQWERETIAVRVKMGMAHRKADNGYTGGPVPAGTLVVGEPGKRRLIVDPKWASVASAAWSMVARGSTLAEVARWLTDQRMPTPRNTSAARTAGKWHVGNLHSWLTNPRMIGLLIDQDTFDAAVAVLGGRTAPSKKAGVAIRRTERIWPFRGLLKCRQCGAALNGGGASGRGGKLHHYLRCTNRLKSGGCTAPDLPAEEYERVLLQAVVDEVRSKKDLIAQLNAASSRAQARSSNNAKRVAEITMERDAIKTRINRILDVVATGGLAADAASERLRTEQATVVQLTHELAQLEGEQADAAMSHMHSETVAEEIRRGVELLLTSPPEVQAKGLPLLIQEIRLDADGAEIFLWPPRAGSSSAATWRSLSDDGRTGPVIRRSFTVSRQGSARKWVVRSA